MEISTGSEVITICKSLKGKDEALSGEQVKPLSPPWGSMEYFKLKNSKVLLQSCLH